jgi:hypothetical protein
MKRNLPIIGGLLLALICCRKSNNQDNTITTGGTTNTSPSKSPTISFSLDNSNNFTLSDNVTYMYTGGYIYIQGYDTLQGLTFGIGFFTSETLPDSVQSSEAFMDFSSPDFDYNDYNIDTANLKIITNSDSTIKGSFSGAVYDYFSGVKHQITSGIFDKVPYFK